MSYDDYINKWLAGIHSEVLFWDRLMESRGAKGGNPQIFKLRISADTPFTLEKEIEHENSTFCDVGSGPFSNCGYLTNSRLTFVAVDPLAFIYEELKRRHGINSPVAPITGMVETLGDQFGQNRFDIVHMSNSLDHCFSPIDGIFQLLFVCKVGGKVILRHNENEAEHAHYKGFHQWNITIENNRFILWRPGERLDVGNLIHEFASVEKAELVQEELLDTSWKHNRFVLRKNKEFNLTHKNYQSVIICKLLEQIGKLSLGV